MIRSRVLIPAILGLICAIPSARGELLNEPQIQWTHSLENSGSLGGRGLRKGNGMTMHGDGNLLVATADDATLHILDTRALRPATPDAEAYPDPIMFEPPTVDQAEPESRSKAVFVHDEGGKVDYLMYAVIDVPIVSDIVIEDGQITSGSDRQVTSRVIAVDLDGTLLWSQTVDGVIHGSPVAGNNGNFIYVVHNVAVDDPNGNAGGTEPNTITRGYVSVITPSATGATILAQKSDASLTQAFGPPSIRTAPDDLLGTIDMVFFSLTPSEQGGQGGLYALLPSAEFEDLGGQGDQSFELKLLSDWPLGAITPPVLSKTFNKAWVTGEGSNVAGWTANRDLTNAIEGDVVQDPRWTSQLSISGIDSDQPLPTAGVLSQDESLLYIVGVKNDLVCLNANNGDEEWSNTRAKSIHAAKPYYFENDSIAVVYVVESVTGTVKQFDADSGRLNWAVGCSEISGITACQDAVEADFVVSPGGNVLYYSTIFGTLVAMEVATFQTLPPTTMPSQAPSTMPSASPSKHPSASPSQTPSLRPTSAPTGGPTSAPTGAPVTTAPTNIRQQTASPSLQPTPQPTSAPQEDTSGTLPPSSTEPDTNRQTSDLGNSGSSLGDVEESWPIFAVVILAALIVGCCVFFAITRRRRDHKDKQDDTNTVILQSAAAYVPEAEVECQIKSDSSAMTDPSMAPSAATPSSARALRTNKNGQSPKTPATLASINEEADDASSTFGDSPSLAERTFVVVDNEPSNANPAEYPETAIQNLDDRFGRASEGASNGNATQPEAVPANVLARCMTINPPMETFNDEEAPPSPPRTAHPASLIPIGAIARAGSYDSEDTTRNASRDINDQRAAAAQPYVSHDADSDSEDSSTMPYYVARRPTSPKVIKPRIKSPVNAQPQPQLQPEAPSQSEPVQQALPPIPAPAPAQTPTHHQPEAQPEPSIAQVRLTPGRVIQQPMDATQYTHSPGQQSQDHTNVPRDPESAARSRFGKSARQKPRTSFTKPTSKPNDWFSQTAAYGSDSESSTSAKPTFKRTSRRKMQQQEQEEEQQQVQQQQQQEREPLDGGIQSDPWNSFLKELEAAEEQFFNPVGTTETAASPTPTPAASARPSVPNMKTTTSPAPSAYISDSDTDSDGPPPPPPPSDTLPPDEL